MKSAHAKDFFKMSATERKGILTLCVVFVLFFSLRLSLPLIFPDDTSAPDFALYIDDVSALKGQDNFSSQLTGFDPNLSDSAELADVGFRDYLIEAIILYRQSNAFHVKDDLLKVRGMSPRFYEKIRHLITLPDGAAANPADRKKPRVVHRAKLEINSADSSALDSLKGVSSYFVSKIMKQRFRLGGFYSLSQLDALYFEREGDTTDWLGIIKDQLTCDPKLVRAIKINTPEEKRLFSHPLIGYQRAKVIVNYKKQHGVFRSMDDLFKTMQFKEEEREALTWYIDFSEGVGGN